MRRGDIVVADLEPTRGSESNKRRPAVLVSNDGANEVADSLRRGVVTVVPLSTNVTRIYPFQVRLDAADTGLRADSKAQAEQTRSLAYERVGKRIGSVPPHLMAQLDDAIRLHLSL